MTLMRRLLWGIPAAGALLAGAALFTQRGASAPKQDIDPKAADLKPAVSLPVSQVILFNSGVAHFTRSGDRARGGHVCARDVA